MADADEDNIRPDADELDPSDEPPDFRAFASLL